MEILLPIKSVDLFLKFLQKLKLVDNSAILEFTPTKFKAKTHHLKTVVKYVDLDAAELFDLTNVKSKESIPNLIKIGIVDIGKLINSLKHFKTNEVCMLVSYSNIKDSLTATQLSFYNQQLKIKIDTANLALFDYISDDIWNNVVLNRSTEIFRFELQKSEFSQLISLSSLNEHSELLSFNSNGNRICIDGGDGEFSMVISNKRAPEGKISIRKDKLTKIDKEDSIAIVTTETVIIHSNESNTIIVISNPE